MCGYDPNNLITPGHLKIKQISFIVCIFGWPKSLFTHEKTKNQKNIKKSKISEF